MSLVALCVRALARFPDRLHHARRRVPASTALLDALSDARDPCLWATLAQLVHPLPPHLHDRDLPLSHPALPLLQKIPDSPDFSLVTLLSLPNCPHLRDDTVPHLRTLFRLIALDLRGCSISSYALTALARGLAVSSDGDPTTTGTWGLRLLSLHGCPNIDNDALAPLLKFPLLSAVDLRFTRCTPIALNACLSSLGFRPSDNSSLFHPAPLSVALCTLEKVALAASDPIPLYSCPPHSVFRLHIDELDHHPSRPKKAVPVDSTSSHSAQDTAVFIPPLRNPAKSESFPPPKPSLSATVSRIDQPTHSSNASSFYGNAPARNRHSRKSILPLSAQAVQSSEGGRLDPLAVARLPPPWKILDTYKSPTLSNSLSTVQGASSHNAENSRRPAQTPNNTLKVDRARLHKRGSDAVADMVHQFSCKRLKVESEFTLAKTRANVSIKSRNPFARSARSVFAESSANTSDEPGSSVHESSKEGEPGTQLRACRSLPAKTTQQPGTGVERITKPLKPITTLKPPILPKELFPSSPRHASKPRTDLKQTRLAYARKGSGSVEHEGG